MRVVGPLFSSFSWLIDMDDYGVSYLQIYVSAKVKLTVSEYREQILELLYVQQNASDVFRVQRSAP